MFIYQNLPELEPCQDPSEISCQDPRSHAKSRDLMCQEPRSYAKSRDFMPRRRDTNRDWRKSRDFFPRPKYYGSKGRNFIPPVRGEKKEGGQRCLASSRNSQSEKAAPPARARCVPTLPHMARARVRLQSHLGESREGPSDQLGRAKYLKSPKDIVTFE